MPIDKDLYFSLILYLSSDDNCFGGDILRSISEIKNRFENFEIIFVLGAQRSASPLNLQELLVNEEIANYSIYKLKHPVNAASAIWIGVEASLGDIIATIDLSTDDFKIILGAVNDIDESTDLICFENQKLRERTYFRRLLSLIFRKLFNLLHGNGPDVNRAYSRILKRETVNHIASYNNADIIYAYASRSKKLNSKIVSYCSDSISGFDGPSPNAIDFGIRLITSTSSLPLRFASIVSSIGAGFNLLYSFYIISIALIKSEVAEGWITTSLQTSGMFFLVSIVLVVMCEYVLSINHKISSFEMLHVSGGAINMNTDLREKPNVRIGN